MWTISVLHGLTLLTVTVCTGYQHGFDGAFICFLSVNADFKAAVDFDDFHANEW